MREAITALPAELARTIIWEQGIELAGHADFTSTTGSPVYLCDTRKPGQCRSNEKTNRLPRQFLPKAPTWRCTPPATWPASQPALMTVLCKTLSFIKPSGKLAELLARTA
jgi:IS30 family transposase